MAAARGFGVDIGGSGIKGAPVDLTAGTLAAERFKLDTPMPSTPNAVAATVKQVVDSFGWDGPIGVTFPGPVCHGIINMAANLGEEWLGCDASQLFATATGRPATVLNDADAAGMAEMAFGAGAGQKGVVLLVTLGTGIGTALFVDGVLVPNTEFGHIEIDGKDAERLAAARVRDDKGLSWEDYAARLDRYLHEVEKLLWPDLVIVGGGISRKSEKFIPLLTVGTPVVPARNENQAGIIGAALAASG